jgi:hypothetical protein
MTGNRHAVLLDFPGPGILYSVFPPSLNFTTLVVGIGAYIGCSGTTL